MEKNSGPENLPNMQCLLYLHLNILAKINVDFFLSSLYQFDAQHTRGSSHGGSRITRKAYPKPHYVQMMKDAFPMWDEIETKSNKQLYLWAMHA